MNRSRGVRVMRTIGLLVLMATVGARAGTVYYANVNSTNPIPPFTNCVTGAIKIQDAVNLAAPGDTVHICAGDYYEQVVLVFKYNITLVGEPGVVIHAFPGMVETLKPHGGWLWYPSVALYRSSVVLSGLTIDGEHLAHLYTTNSGGTLPSRLLGIYLLGASGTVSNCTLKGFRASTLETYTDADALQVLNVTNTGAPAVNVRVVDSTFIDNQASILLRGDPINVPTVLRTSVSIKGNTITGLGAVPTVQYGIWIVTGVDGEVTGNTLMNHGYTGTRWNFCSAISAFDAYGRPFLPLKPICYDGNAFSNNGGGLVLVGADNSQVLNNKFLGTNGPSWGALAVSGTNILVADNNFSEVGNGILLLGDEPFAVGWPAVLPAVNPVLATNWFCNVTEPIWTNPIATGVTVSGTQTCPFQPVFRSLTTPAPGEVRTVLRGWHGETVVLEASTNLVDWLPLNTHLMELPTYEFRDTSTEGVPQRFYRARRL